jgi:uncharacterized protein (TIGR03066 family)
MRTIFLVTAAFILFGPVGRVRADEPDDKAAAEIKKALVGKWKSDNKDVGPLEFTADGKINQPFIPKDSKWVIAEGKFTVDAKGEVKWHATIDGISLSGWYKYKDGVLTTAKGPHPNVTYKKVEEEKKEEKK